MPPPLAQCRSGADAPLRFAFPPPPCTYLKPGEAHAMSCRLAASSWHVSTRAAKLNFVSMMHCWGSIFETS